MSTAIGKMAVLLALGGALALAQPAGTPPVAAPDAPDPAAVAEEVDDAPELTERTQTAIDRGLEFLIGSQNADGSWSRGNPYRGQETLYEVADTALVLMAFMAKAHFPGEGPYGDELDKGLDFLLRESKASVDGYLGTSMYAHGLATLALSEVWGMSDGDRDDEVLKALRRAVEVILRSQNIRGGWRYDPNPKDADLSVTVTQIVTLASVRQAGLVVPDVTIDKAIDYVTTCWHEESGGFTYKAGYYAGPRFALSAGATYALQLCGRRDSEQVKAGMRYLTELRDQGRIFHDTGYYFYGHYYGIQAMVQAGDSHYEAWYPRIRDALLLKQAPDGSWSGGRGGRPQSTAMALIVLGTPYRYIPIYQR